MDSSLTAWLMTGTHLQISNRSDNVLFQCKNYCFSYNFSDDLINSDRLNPGFLSKGMCLLAQNTSRELVWSDSTHNVFFHIEQGHTYVGGCQYSTPTIGIHIRRRWPSLVRRAVFRMTLASIHSYFILWMDCCTSSNKRRLRTSLEMGVFLLKV